MHNGIIENYLDLKRELIEEGHKFATETDTEVIAHLVEKYFKGTAVRSKKRPQDRQATDRRLRAGGALPR